MAIAYCAAQISPHMARTPEGYLICYSVPINRIGKQLYMAGELGLEGGPNRLVTIYRLEEDVFAPSAVASFEGKDVTAGHPPEMVTAGTYAAYHKGHVENVRRVGDNTVADLVIKDPSLSSDVENGVVREVSCGYECVFVPYLDGYKQTNIMGNHVAVVPKGRAGSTVAIQDAATKAEKGRNRMNEFRKASLIAFATAAKDASPEELEKMASAAVDALDAAPAAQAPEAEPAKKEEPPAGSEAGHTAPAKDAEPSQPVKDSDMDSKLDELLSLLRELVKKDSSKKLSNEGDLDAMISKLSDGKADPNAAVNVPVGGKPMDGAVELLRKIRPVVAGIKDATERSKVVDALLSSVCGESSMSAIMTAAKDNAAKAAAENKRTSFEAMCEEAQNAYSARNPHKKKEG